MQFSLEVNLDVAEQEVQAAMNAAATFLPRDLPAPPVYKQGPSGRTAPILTLADSATLPLPQVRDLRKPVPRKFRSSPASAWSASVAGSVPRYGSKRIQGRWHPMD